MGSTQKELKKVLEAAEEQGWRVKRLKSGHYMLFSPDGINKVTMAGTAGNTEALNNELSRLRRYGFQWKGR
jgi:predicted RNA binding protein YcfA (HicA-like mRNA interferase family)